MDKISKALQKLSVFERNVVKTLLNKIKNSSLRGIDIKKLKGHENIFRARKGKIRIIYKIDNESEIQILTIARRSEDTYKRNF